MFLVCDPIVWGEEHVPYNTGLLKTIRSAFPDEVILFYGEKKHTEFVRSYLGRELSNTVNWNILNIAPRHSGFYHRFASDLKNVRLVLKELNEQAGDNVLVISGNSSLLWAFKLSSRQIQDNIKIQIILHGGLASLTQQRYSLKSRIRYLDPFIKIQNIRTSLKIFHKKQIKYIVLEESIRDAVLNEIPKLHNYIEVIDHPIPTDNQTFEYHNINLPLQIGFLGRATESKGFSSFLRVASEISSQFPDMVKFHVIGRSVNDQKDNDIKDMTFLHTKPFKGRLSRDEYVKRVMNLHFVCLFFNERQYALSASGVLLDCIAFEKPVIATQLPIFKNIEQKYGEIGYLCNSPDFSDTIAMIINKLDNDRYRKQVLNMHQVKESRTPESLAFKYRQIVKRWN